MPKSGLNHCAEVEPQKGSGGSSAPAPLPHHGHKARRGAGTLFTQQHFPLCTDMPWNIFHITSQPETTSSSTACEKGSHRVARARLGFKQTLRHIYICSFLKRHVGLPGIHFLHQKGTSGHPAPPEEQRPSKPQLSEQPAFHFHDEKRK